MCDQYNTKYNTKQRVSTIQVRHKTKSSGGTDGRHRFVRVYKLAAVMRAGGARERVISFVGGLDAPFIGEFTRGLGGAEIFEGILKAF
eukprot:SAG31_NODE_2280_length_6025_cov_8.850321_7_plen_88_part_00